MTLEDLSKLLLKDEYLALDISSTEFPDLEQYLVGRA